MLVVKHNDEIIATASSVEGAVQAVDDCTGYEYQVTNELSSTRYQLTSNDGSETEMELIKVEHYE